MLFVKSNSVPSDEISEIKSSCPSRHGMIKNSHYSCAISAEQRHKLTSLLTQRGTLNKIQPTNQIYVIVYCITYIYTTQNILYHI